MSVQDMLKEMSSRVFNSSYDSYMRNAYDSGLKRISRKKRMTMSKGSKPWMLF